MKYLVDIPEWDLVEIQADLISPRSSKHGLHTSDTTVVTTNVHTKNPAYELNLMHS